MADEITLQARLTVSNGDYRADFNPGTIKIDQATLGANGGIMILSSSSEEALPIGDVVSEGMVMIRNLDATNFITFGPDHGGLMRAIGKLKAGEFALLRLLPSASLLMKADTADCKVQFLLLED